MLNYNKIYRKIDYQTEKVEFVDINICGIRYTLLKSQLRKFPGSVLSRLSYIHQNGSIYNDELPDGVEWNSSMNEFVINRTPRLFDIILQYYINGKLHVPKWACKDEVADELAFWELNAFHTCKKCYGKRMSCDSDSDDNDDDDDDTEQFSNMLINRRRGTYFKRYNKWGSMKRNLRHFLEQPKSSFYAKIYATLFVSVIFISLLNFAIGTVDELQFCPNDTTLGMNSNYSLNKTNLKPMSFLGDYFDVNGENFFSECVGTIVFQSIDLFSLVCFTIDLFLRIIACQELLKFLSSPLHVIELIVVLPYYIEIILWCQIVTVNDSQTLFFILRLFQTIRILNVFKLARYFDDLKILGVVLKSSKREMCMLLLFVFVSVLIAANIVYQLESSNDNNNPFYNVMISCWWGIVTLSTVGYGDMVPGTVSGKIAAGLLCVCGILCVAFPMAVLVEYFRSAYKKNKKNKNLSQLQKATKLKDEEKRKKSVAKIHEIHQRIIIKNGSGVQLKRNNSK